MIIRASDLADINNIVALDAGYSTESVWQLATKEAASEMSAALKLAPLPRLMKIAPVLEGDALRRVISRCDFVWVMQGDAPRDILGYLGMAAVPWQNAGWISCLAVAPSHRRQGVATRLLGAARARAKAENLASVVMDVQTKNYPATKLCQRNGFKLAGYLDNFYPTRDIALLYQLKI
ncbi:MAG TPA: GNAT family N-acetyltransferase [Thermoflexales bacterium]|nr:GNAT family N-acetyltransferase [Thermoflexales bacterium]HQW34677.1 GNAT family N-acetyltransferase [Thermoflexales bacterium]HQZ22010.1 GNAT family N-acetyltransferase [Thermoflexales bacterium]HRA00125.1 GNAT family N-acetyltransferase [Thermoflexales bacterium]